MRSVYTTLLDIPMLKLKYLTVNEFELETNHGLLKSLVEVADAVDAFGKQRCANPSVRFIAFTI